IEEKPSPLEDYGIDMTGVLNLHYFVSPPLVSNGTIYIAVYNGHGFLGAFDAQTGQQRWAIERKEGMISPPVVVGDTAYVGAGARTIVSIDVTTGNATG